ncbi:MAG: glycosyltransferase family 4 protein [Brevefilum sp.]
MRIALLTETFLPKIDGVVKSVCHLLDHLEKRGHQTLLLAPEGSPERYANTRVIQMKAYRPFFYPEFRFVSPLQNISPYLNPFKPDLIHAVNPFSLGKLGIMYASEHSIPLVASYQTDLPGHVRLWGFNLLEKPVENYLYRLHKQADLNLAPSHATQRELIGKGYKNVKVWTRGIDSAMFNPGHWSRSMREYLTNGNTHAPLLLYVGRLSKEKRVEMLLPIVQAIPRAQLAIVGDGPLRPELEALFAGTNTKFTGYLYDEDLAKAYASSDIFVFPGANETFGNVILEAMASGLPVVAPRAGGILDTVIDRKTGLLFEANNNAEMVYDVQRLINSCCLSREMGRAARVRAETFSWDNILDKLLNDYRQVIQRHKPQGQLKGKPRSKLESLFDFKS